MRTHYYITDGLGNFITRLSLSSELSLTDNREFAYSWDSESQAQSVISSLSAMDKFHGIQFKSTTQLK